MYQFVQQKIEHSQQHDFSALCRACLQLLPEADVLDARSDSKTAYDIFESPELAKKLSLCTSLNVDPDENYPKNLCYCCFHKVNEFFQFRSMCVESMERLQAAVKGHIALQFEDEKPNFDFDTKSHAKITVDATCLHFDSETIKRDDRAAEETPVCGNNTRRLRSKESAIMETVAVKSENTQHLKEDLEAKSDSANEDKEKQSQSEGESIFPTSMAKRKSSNKKIQRQKGVSEGSKRKTSTSFQCDICPARFKVEHRLVAHKRAHDGLAPYPCPREGCDKVFNRWHRLSNHLKQHEGINNGVLYTCDIDGCDKVYKHKPTMVLHQRKCHKRGPELKSHVCEICGKVFKASTILNHHRYTHKDKSELPFVCDQPNCTRRFSKKEKLKVHQMRHAGIKNFVCPYCGMRKTTRNELNIHINYHTLERTWPCRFCEHVCNSAGNLRMHVRTVHERAKDYACSFCDQTFAKPDTRKYHEMTHTGEKPNECGECGKRFTQPAALRTHRKIHLRQRTQIDSERSNEGESPATKKGSKARGRQRVGDLLDSNGENLS